MSVPTLNPAALTARIEAIASTCGADSVAAALSSFVREFPGLPGDLRMRTRIANKTGEISTAFDVLLDHLDAWEARTSG
jgi:hypothetical protein